jgi:hypothetical protein
MQAPISLSAIDNPLAVQIILEHEHAKERASKPQVPETRMCPLFCARALSLSLSLSLSHTHTHTHIGGSIKSPISKDHARL